MQSTAACGVAILMLWAGFTSCSPVVYSVTGQNVPMFREKGEFTASAAYAASPDVSGLELQGAVALTDHIGVLASFYTLGNNKREFEDGWAGNGNFTELGGGYFGSLGKRQFFLYEAYGGIGFGNIQCDGSDRSVLNSRYIKPFIQPSIGFRGRIVELALTTRAGLLHYTGHTAALMDQEQQKAADDFFDRRKTSFVFEPGLLFRIGFKQLKVQFQYTLSTFKDEAVYNLSSQEYVSIGVRYMFSENWPTARRLHANSK